MSDFTQTDWSEVRQSAFDPDQEKTQQSLSNIVKRFKTPITFLFVKRLRSFYGPGHEKLADQDAEEMFCDFIVYLMERREEIFGKANPKLGKLRTFLYTIAWRYANDWLAKQKNKPLYCDDIECSQDDALEQEYEIEYVNLLLNRVLKKLKLESISQYRLFKRKYFSGNPQISALQLATKQGLIKEEMTPKEIKTVENTIHQNLSRGRLKFLEFLKREIIETIDSEEDLQKEMELFKKHIGVVSVDLSMQWSQSS